MRVLLALAVCLLLAASLAAEEESGVTCDLPALRFERDGRLLKIYDGLRRGLEKARLGRVCEEQVSNDAAALDAFARGLTAEQVRAAAGERAQPVAFAFGDKACAALVGRAITVPRVFVLTRFTAGSTPLAPLPKPQGPSSVVYANMRMERLGEVIGRLVGKRWARAKLAWRAVPETAERSLARASDVSALTLSRLGANASGSEGPPEVVLHLRLGVGETLMPLAEAARAARKAGVPLVTDDPLRFRQGVAAVVIATQHDLVGRYAAEAARVLTRHPTERLPARGVMALQVWVDLDAVDRQGLSLPLPFLARANVIYRSPVPARPGGGR